MSTTSSLPTMLAWHIFRKDARLLWPLAAASAALQALLGVVRVHADVNSPGDEAQALGALVALALAVSMALLVILVVQQDMVPGAEQDWLVRPVRRRDLLLAKLLGIGLLLHAPLVMVNVAVGVAEGLASGEALGAAVLATSQVALLLTLPLFAVASFTSSVAEALLGVLVAVFAIVAGRVVAASIAFPFTHLFTLHRPTDGSAIAWIGLSLSHAVLLVTVVVVLWRQYFHRSTRRSRVFFIGGVFAYALAPGLPWHTAFALQQWLAPDTGGAAAMTIAFDSSHARPADDRDAVAAGAFLKTEPKRANSDTAVDSTMYSFLLPVRISDRPDDAYLHVDRAVVRLVDAGGHTLYRGNADAFDLAPAAATGTGTGTHLYQRIALPRPVVDANADAPVLIAIDYSITLLRAHPMPPAPVLGRHERIGDFGRCSGSLDAAAALIDVDCYAAGKLPACFSIALVEHGRPNRESERYTCALNYQPGFLRFTMDPIDHESLRLPLLTPAGPDRRTLDGSRAENTRIAVTVYEPEAHLSRHIVTSELRLRDWLSELAGAGDASTPNPRIAAGSRP